MVRAYNAHSAATQAENQEIEKRHARSVSDAAMAEFLARGGKVQQVGNNVSGVVEGASYSAWGAKRKKTEDTPTIDVDEDDEE
jgi:flagellar capping protein FliD